MTVEQLWQRVPGGSGTYIRELLAEYTHVPDVSVTGISAWHRASAVAEADVDVPLRHPLEAHCRIGDLISTIVGEPAMPAVSRRRRQK